LWASPTVADGTVFFGTGSATYYALDAATGAMKWKTQLGNPGAGPLLFSSAAVYNGIVYTALGTDEVQCADGQVVALNEATGAIVWTFDTIDPSSCPPGMSCSGGGVWATPTVDARFGTLFVGVGNANATCTGATLPIALPDRYPDTLLALDLATGKLKTYYQVTPQDALDMDIGAEATLFQTESINDCDSDDQVSYWVSVGSKDEAVFTFPRGPSGLTGPPGVNPLDLSELVSSEAVSHFTQYQSCGTGTLQSKQIQANLYQATSGENVYGLRETGSGKLAYIWKTPPKTFPVCPSPEPDACSFFSSPASTGDVMFIGGQDNNIYGLDSLGELLWGYPTGGPIYSSPAISHAAVYIASYDGYVYCFTLNGL
jgi:outer membrane protein assembly factor BamB